MNTPHSTPPLGQNIEKHVLDNGLTVYIKPMPENDTVTVNFWYRTGVLNETPDNSGISHYLEHMIFKGTEKYGPGEADVIIDSLGGMNNAATSLDYTHYYVHIGKDNWHEAFKVFAELLLNPMFDKEEFERERYVVLEEYRRKMDNPMSYLTTMAYHQTFKNHPYAMEVLGTPESINNISREMMIDYYQEFYRPDNKALFIFGNIDPQDVLRKVENFYAEIPPKEGPVYSDIHKELSYNTGLYEYFFRPMQDSYMAITFPGPSIHDPEYPVMDIISTILGTGNSSRLTRTIRDDLQLAHSISCFSPTLYAGGMTAITAMFNPEHKNELHDAVSKIIRDIAQNGVSQEELDRAKKMILTDITFERESTASLTSYFGYYYALTGSIENGRKYPDRIQQVTPEEVQEVAQKYLDMKKANSFFVFPNELKDYFLPQIKEVRSFENITKYNVHDIPFIVHPKPGSPIMAMDIFLPFGSAAEPDDKKGLFQLLGSLLNKGTKTRDADTIARTIEGLGADFSVQVQKDFIRISTSCLREDFDDLSRVIWDILKNSTFPEREFLREKELQKNAIRLKINNRMRFAFDKASQQLFEGTPYQYPPEGTLDTVENISREDIIHFYETYFGSNNFLFVITGDIDAEDFLPAISEQLAFIRKGTSLENPPYKEISLDQPRFTVQEEDIEQSNIATIYPGVPFHDRENMASFRILLNVLGRGMSSILFRELRDTHGLAYIVGGIPINQKEQSAALFYIGTQNARAGEALQGMDDIIKRVQREGITQEDLEKGINNFIGVYRIQNESSASQNYLLGYYEVMGLGFEYFHQIEDDIRAVTIEDVRNIAQQILTEPVTFILGDPVLEKE